MNTLIVGSLSGIALTFAFVVPTFAHVIVSPSTVGIGKTQEFSMSVPAEKDNPTIGIRLMIPAGLKSVTPNVKAGWTISEVKSGSGNEAIVSEIDWTGGSIPPGQRDDFLFQAQVPAKETTLKWKAIQQYSDGSTVAWVNNPTSNPEDDSAPPPYSQTKVVNDLTGAEQGTMTKTTTSSSSANTAMIFSLIALAISVVTFAASRKK